MRAIGYLRVSTSKQAVEGVSLAAQREKIQAWAKLNETLLEHCYSDEGISGKGMGQRPGLAAAIEHACRRKSALVVYSLSRLARSTRDTLAITDRLERAGADLVSLSERIDSTTASGKMVFRMLAVLAEFERDCVSERTTSAMKHLRDHGLRISRFAPFGWRFGKDGRSLAVVPAEQDAIRLMARLRKTGKSYAEIAAHLDRRHVPTKRHTGRWFPKCVRSILKRHSAAA